MSRGKRLNDIEKGKIDALRDMESKIKGVENHVILPVKKIIFWILLAINQYQQPK